MIHCDNWDNVNKKYHTNILECYDGVVFKPADDFREYVVAFNRLPKGHVIAHESVHLVSRIFEDICVKLDSNNDEPQAYLTGWFFEQIEKFFKIT